MYKIENVSMIYDMESDDKLYALNGFSLELPDKGLVGVIGPSGSGKSTLMYCMSTLKKPTEGSIRLPYPEQSSSFLYGYPVIVFEP